MSEGGDSLRDHSDFYKHISTLGLVTFAGSVTLSAAVPDGYDWWLLLAGYMALSATILSLRAMRVILSEGRVPHARKGASTAAARWFNLNLPYLLLVSALFLIALLVAVQASRVLSE